MTTTTNTIESEKVDPKELASLVSGFLPNLIEGKTATIAVCKEDQIVFEEKLFECLENRTSAKFTVKRTKIENMIYIDYTKI